MDFYQGPFVTLCADAGSKKIRPCNNINEDERARFKLSSYHFRVAGRKDTIFAALTLEGLVPVDADCGLAGRRFTNDRYHTIPEINQERERAIWAGGIVIPENPDDGTVRVGEGATFGKPITGVEIHLLTLGGSHETGEHGQAYPRHASLAPTAGCVAIH